MMVHPNELFAQNVDCNLSKQVIKKKLVFHMLCLLFTSIILKLPETKRKKTAVRIGWQKCKFEQTIVS